jgi:hypothetical protein
MRAYGFAASLAERGKNRFNDSSNDSMVNGFRITS